MSWRLLTFTLLLFAGVATALGLQAGNYLIERVPQQANIPNVAELDPPVEYDALGNIIIPQPMQPLLDGGQGLPEDDLMVAWQIDPDSLEETVDNEEHSAMYAEENRQLSGVVTQGSTAVSSQVFRPIQNQPTFRPSPAPQGGSGAEPAWVMEFNSAMARCRTLGFNERPACIARTRQQYCGAYNAWGRVADCPAQ